MSPRSLMLTAVAVVAAVALSGCSPASKLVGKWQLDTSAATEQLSGGNQTAAALMNMAQAFSMDLEFKGDGNLAVTGSMFGQPHTVQGTWRYVKSEGDILVLMMKPNQASNETELRVRFIEADRIEMVPPNWNSQTTGKALPFNRVKPS